MKDASSEKQNVQSKEQPSSRKPTTGFLKHHPLGQNRFERSQSQSKADLMLKEDHSVDLSQLSSENLKNLLKKQKKLIDNK